jgi:hypothetical protein
MSGPSVPKSGTNVPKTATEKWVPVEGKPHLWKDEVSGRMKYTPPEPQPTWPFTFP